MFKNYFKAVDIAHHFLEKCKVGSPKHDITQDVFFQSSNTSIRPQELPFNKEYVKHINRFCMETPIPLQLKILYYLINSSNREITFKEFTLFSIQNIIQRFEKSKYLGIINFLDIGLKYLGMGHICVLTLDLNKQMCFLRYDGGSNGYDRSYHLECMQKLKSSHIPKDYYFSVEQFLKEQFNQDTIYDYQTLSK